MSKCLKNLLSCIPWPSSGAQQEVELQPRPQPATPPARPASARGTVGVRSARANVERSIAAGKKAVRPETVAGGSATPADERDLAFGSPQSARVKDRGGQAKAPRGSEFDAEAGVFRIHPGRVAIPCTGAVDPSAREALNRIGAELRQELDHHLASVGADSSQQIPRGSLVKAVVPYKWIVSDDMQIMLGKSKLPPPEGPSGAKAVKMGHITLIGGTADPKGRLGGLLYCTKNADGAYQYCLDNDSGRFSEAADRTPAQLANVANRLNQLQLEFKVHPVWIDLIAPA